uniref:THH1/TOM1/TOM3 domain-containing protein n=1 Tax=Brassica oleracea TaxID=3712 RepID=A0A3P6E5Q0_BRAOL|nr:unnamed protein product [Brassica oleracea]
MDSRRKQMILPSLVKLDEGVGVRIVNCSSLVDQSKLVSGTIVTLQSTFTIIRILPPKVNPLVWKMVYQHRGDALCWILLDLPGLLFFSAYTLLVLFWAEIYHQARI